MDTEEDIERAAEQIMKDTGGSRLDALNMLLGKYQSQRRLEEAVRVQTIIKREQVKQNTMDMVFNRICSSFVLCSFEAP